MTTTLNIIGCGKVGRTLARLWREQDVLQMQAILNRSGASGEDAVAFIGAGRAAASLADMAPAGLTLIGVPDDRIAAACAAAVAAGVIVPGSVVFHCSGALPSTILQAAGAHVASVHPIRSFADPAAVARGFDGTCCGAEGDAAALALLSPLFAAIGAQLVPIRTDAKILYHAAAVFASNYLVTLMDTAVQAYGAAGVDQQTALKLMQPLVRDALDNVFRLGPAGALTGPIARGDTATVVRQYRAVGQWDRRYGALYRQMGRLTLKLARRR